MTLTHLAESVGQADLDEVGFEIVNLVATIDLNRELDLRQLASDIPASEYHPERFPFLVYRPEQPDATALIPTNGAVSVSGAKSKEQLIETAENLLSNLSKLRIQVDVDVGSLELQNVVATGELDVELDLATVTLGLGTENCEYEPEQFPGLSIGHRDRIGFAYCFHLARPYLVERRIKRSWKKISSEVSERIDELF